MDIKVTRQKSDTCKKWNFKVETKLLYENMSIEFHILKEFLTVIESVELRYAIIIGNFLQKDPCCGLKKNTPSFISFLDQFSLFGVICYDLATF